MLVTKGIVSFQCHSDSQDAYLEVIYEIARAFLEVRETLAWKKFHKHLYELTEEQRESIGKAIPVRVVELTEFVGAYDGIQLVADDVEVDDVEINNRFIQRCMEQLIRAGDCELWY